MPFTDVTGKALGQIAPVEMQAHIVRFTSYWALKTIIFKVFLQHVSYCRFYDHYFT